MSRTPAPKLTTVARLRAEVRPAARKHLDWIWEFYLAHGEWPTDRRIYRDTLKPDFERILATMNGAHVQEVEERDLKTYHVMPIGILCTSRGAEYERLLRRYVEHLRHIYYNQDKQNSVTHAEVQQAMGLTEEQTVTLGRLLKVGILSTCPGHNDAFTVWSTQLPSGLGDILPHQGNTDEAFEVLMRRHWTPLLQISAHERARAMYATPFMADFSLAVPPAVVPRPKPKRRERISAAAVAQVTTESCRRCALCFGLHGDLEVKEGQIVHINRMSSQSKPGNLVWLCLPHHAQYDTISNRNRGFSAEELKVHRAALWAAIKRKEHFANGAPPPVPAKPVITSPFEAALTESPQAAVLLAWQKVEQTALRVLQTKMAIPNPELMPAGVRSNLLREFAGVDLAKADLHDQLGAIRNAVTHGAPIDEVGARAFCEKATELIAYLGTK